MHRLLTAALAATVLFLTAAPVHAGPGADQQRHGGPEVQITSSLDCSSTDQLGFWFVVQNSGPTLLHIEPPVHAVVRVPGGMVTQFFGFPAPGFDVIEPGGEVRFGILVDRADMPSAFDAKRIVFGVDVHFEEEKNPAVRYTVFPGCS